MGKKYSTKISCEGAVYVHIANVMTEMGYPMNHCTARNVVLQVMERCVVTLAKKNHVRLTEKKIREIAQSPEFQAAMTVVFDRIEAQGRRN